MTTVILSLFVLLSFQNCSSGLNSSENKFELSSQNPVKSFVQSQSTEIEINSFRPYTYFSEFKLYDKLDIFNNEVVSKFSNLKIYRPQYPMFNDSADSRRFFYIPAGAQIDSSDPDEWVYPKSSIFFQELSFAGKKVETRVFEKIADGAGPSTWRSSVYLWRKDQTDAELLTEDDFYNLPIFDKKIYLAQEIESQYKVLKQSSCNSCHSSPVDMILGFNYLQLSNSDLKVNLNTIKNEDILFNPPTGFDEIKGSFSAKLALGYLQSNCATCHDGRLHPLNFKHSSKVQSALDENVNKSIEISKSTSRPLVTFGDLSQSSIYTTLVSKEMPSLNFYRNDSIGLNIISNWILEVAGPKQIILPLVVNIISGPQNFSNLKSPSFVFSTGQNSGLKFKCQLDDLAEVNCASPFIYSNLIDGVHSFKVRSINSTNQSSVVTTRSWIQDTIAPTTSVIQGPALLTENKSAEIIFTSNESVTGSGIFKSECSLNGASFQNCTSPVAYKNLNLGNYRFIVRTTDNAGNIGVSAQYSWTIKSPDPLPEPEQPPPPPPPQPEPEPAKQLFLTDCETVRSGLDFRSDDRFHAVSCPKDKIMTNFSAFATRHIDGDMSINCCKVQNSQWTTATARVSDSNIGGNRDNQEHHHSCAADEFMSGIQIYANKYFDGAMKFDCVKLTGAKKLQTNNFGAAVNRGASITNDFLDDSFHTASCQNSSAMTALGFYAEDYFDNITRMTCSTIIEDK